MTVAELIRELERFPKNMPVVRLRHGEYVTRWETMDGHWFQTVLVRRSDSPLNAGSYYEARSKDEAEGTAIEALEL
jgi:hypothetical protein